MDSDPWADTPPTPRSGTPRVSLEKVDPGPSTLAKSDSPQSFDNEEQRPESTAEEIRIDTPEAEEGGERRAVQVGSPVQAQEEADGFDDFDDFDAPEAGPSTAQAEGADDGFGDFWDFEEGDFEEAGESVPGVTAEAAQPGPSAGWRALNLRPFPTTSEVLDQLSDILRPLVPPEEALSAEPVRSVGGLSQVMVAESSRDVYAQLTTAPMLKPLDWTRSRVRREHLISMGVPVNLDEVDSHRLSALPPLRITTSQGTVPTRRAQSMEVNGAAHRLSSDRPASALSARDKGKGRETVVGSGSAGAMSNGDKSGKYGLGEKPEMNMDKAEELCGIEEDRLSLLPLASLRKIQDELVETSAQASAALAWGLQLKDSQAQDSATYNGMISELISNAAKAKSAQQAGSGGVFRRSSQKVRPTSGASTPRVGSPAMR